MYGATSGESGRLVAGLTRRYPAAFGLVEEAARAGERGQVVRTLLGRGSPALGEAWDQDPDAPPPIPTAWPATGAPTGASPATSSCRARAPSGRCAGSPTCATGCGGSATTGSLPERPHLVFFLHDEVVVHTPAALAEASPRRSPQRPPPRRTSCSATCRRLPAQHLDRAVLRRRRQALGAPWSRRPAGRGLRARSARASRPGMPTADVTAGWCTLVQARCEERQRRASRTR